MREQLEALRIDRDAVEPRRSRGLLWVLLAVVLLVVVAAAVWWARSGGSTPEVELVAAVERGSGGAATVLNASGYVVARRRASVSVEITGMITEVNVEEGMPVEKGQVLARLDDSQYRAALGLAESRAHSARKAVEETEARVRLAELTLERTERLAADDVLGQAELDAAETELSALRARLARERQEIAVADSEVALRRTQLEDTVIVAPFDGVVISKDAQPGETISTMAAMSSFTRTGVCTIVDMDSLEIEVDVNESYISRVHRDQPVEAVLDAYPDWTIPARVITTIPTADRQKATVQVRIAILERDPRILPDMGVKVAFRDAAEADDDAPAARVYVPRSAVRRMDDRDVVFVYRDGRLERRAVSVSPAGEEFVVEAGLRAGERVVSAGPAELVDGQRVSLR